MEVALGKASAPRPAPTRRAILLGASGLVGSHCLDLLLADDSYAGVVSLGRRALEREHPKLRQETVEFGRIGEMPDLFRGADDLFCCLGTTIRKAGSQEAFRTVDLVYPVQSAHAASRAGVAQFLLVSSLGANPRSPVFYNRVKGEVEGAVSRLGFHGVHIFRPSLLLGARTEFRLGERVGGALMGLAAPLAAGKFRRYRPIEARAVALCMIKVAKSTPMGLNIFESDTIRAIAEGRL